MQKYYPIFISIAGKKVLVVGGGKVAERKIIPLLEKKAVIHIVSPEITEKLHDLAVSGQIIWYNRKFKPQDIQDAWLVIAATNDPVTQKFIADAATTNRIFCNMVSEPEEGSFITPSVIEHGPIQVAISTSGSSPLLTKRLKQELTPVVIRHPINYVNFLERMRKWIIHTEPTPKRREELLLALDNPEIEDFFITGQWRALEDWVKKNYGDNALDIVKKHTKL